MSGPGVNGVTHSCFGLAFCSYSGGSSHNPRARVSSRLIKFDSDFMIPQKISEQSCSIMMFFFKLINFKVHVMYIEGKVKAKTTFHQQCRLDGRMCILGLFYCYILKGK